MNLEKNDKTKPNDYEKDLEDNFEKATPISDCEKQKHIDRLKQAANNYTTKKK